MTIRTALPIDPTTHARLSFRRAASGAIACCALLSAAAPSTALAQSVPERTAEPESPTFTIPRDLPLLDDRAEDGTLWVSGSTYKAGFGAAGTSYVPYLGSQAPRNFPVRFALSSVRIGGEELAFERDIQAERIGDRVDFDHGSVRESYNLSPDAMEQVFTFDALPRRGTIEIEVAVHSELTRALDAGRVRFANAHGHVDYGRAIVFDQRGERADVTTELSPGGLRLTVDADFVARAELPLVVDPLINTFTVNATTGNDYAPDIAYQGLNNRYGYVWTRLISLTDSDAYYSLCHANGFVITPFVVDNTPDDCDGTRIANSDTNDSFLIVSSVSLSGQNSKIRGRWVPLGSAPQAWYDISPFSNWPLRAPTIGGDSATSGPGYFLIAWERHDSPSDVDLLARGVPSDGTVPTGTVYSIASGALREEAPSFSKTPGSGSDSGARHTLAWQRRNTATDHDIFFSQFSRDGTLLTGPVSVAVGSLNDRFPSVSSRMDSVPGVTGRPHMIVWQRDISSQFERNLIGAVYENTTQIASADLSAQFESSSDHRDQADPSVDCDGQQFLVGYIEADAVTGLQRSARVSTYFLSDNQIQSNGVHIQVDGGESTSIRIAAQGPSSPGYGRHGVAWSKVPSGGTQDVFCGTFVTNTAGALALLCDGDGSGVACPCSNPGAPDHGCASSVNPNGAQLTFSGSAIVSDDSLVLTSSGMPTTASCLFFQGTALSNNGDGTLFGDGKRCAAGSILRLAAKTAVNGVAIYPGVGEPPVSERGLVPAIGATRYYQSWYRNAANFCTTSTFNTSNGVRAIWSR